MVLLHLGQALLLSRVVLPLLLVLDGTLLLLLSKVQLIVLRTAWMTKQPSVLHCWAASCATAWRVQNIPMHQLETMHVSKQIWARRMDHSCVLDAAMLNCTVC